MTTRAKRVAVPEVYAPEAEARLEAVRQHIEAWLKARKAWRGYPPGPLLRGVDENKLYEAERNLERARLMVKSGAPGLKQVGKAQHGHVKYIACESNIWEKEVKKRERELKRIELEIVAKLRRTRTEGEQWA